MGAENSNLRSIESLNSSLTEIEKRMFYLEGVKFHHERTGAVDDSVLISGKLIRCNLRVELLVGPIIGTIGSDFARIVVETELQEELTINIFEVQRLQFDTPLFLSTIVLRTNAGVPTAITLPNLTANTFYFVYVGGVNSNCTLTNYALFRTLPTNPDYVRTLYVNNSRVDANSVSNTSLWTHVNTRCLDLFTIKEHQNKAGPAHLIVHTGNLLSIDNILHEQYAQVVDHLLSHNSSEAFVLSSLAEAERQIREHYRKALNSENVRHIVKRCGCIFLAGEGESGRGFSAQFNADESETASPIYELKMQLLGMFMRMARRVCWSYYRLLWDDAYPALAEDDSQREFFHKSILLTRMNIANKKRMQTSLEDCLLNTKREFGVEFHAYKEVLASCDTMKTDLKKLDQTLRQLSVQSSEYNTNHESHANGSVLSLGAVSVMLVEAVWGVVGEDGSASVEVLNAVNIHQQIFDDLQRILSNPALDNKRHSVIFVTSTTLNTQETLEMTEYNLNRNQYALSRNNTASYTFADIDIKKLIETLMIWQKQSTNYSVLLVESDQNQYAARGVIQAIQDENEANMTGLQYIRTGCMELHNNIKWKDFDRFFTKHQISEQKEDTLKHTNVIEYQGDSFWDVVFLPKMTLTLDTNNNTNNDAYNTNNNIDETQYDDTKLIQLSCVIREMDTITSGGISFGPSIGRITSDSVEIYIEFTTSGDQKITIVDQITGDECLSVKFVQAGRVICFQFNHLKACTAYDIMCTQCGTLPLIVGSFTTHKVIELIEKLEDIVDDAHTLRILRENDDVLPAQTQQPVPMYQSITLLLMGGQKSIVTESTPTEIIPPSSAVPSVVPSRAITPAAASSRPTTSSRPGTTDSRMSFSSKVAVAGSVAPSVSVASRPGTADTAVLSVNNNNKVQTIELPVTERAIATQLVHNVLSQGYCGVDLTVTFESNVNWSTVVEPVILLLSKAENQVLNSFASGQRGGALNNTFLCEAEQLLRETYRLNWSKLAELGHSYGSHLTVASPLVEFLTVFDAMFATSKGLSQYVFEQLNVLFAKLHSEYGTLYGKQLHTTFNNNTLNNVHFLAQNTVCIFELTPVLNSNTTSPNHNFETQLYFLSREMSQFGVNLTNKNECKVYTLIITSPLPIVTEDNTASSLTFDNNKNNTKQHYAWTITQTTAILDLLTSWVEVNTENRKCVILCGGVEASFTTTIDIRTHNTSSPNTPLNHNHSTRSLSRGSNKNSRPNTTASNKHHKQQREIPVTITQICCGFNTNPKDTNSFRTDGQLNSLTRQFNFTHNMHSMGCGVVEIPIITTKPRDITHNLQSLQSHCVMLYETQVYKRAQFPVSPLSLQLHDCLEFLYLHSIPAGCMHEKVPEREFGFLCQIKAFISSVSQREEDVFKKCHAMFCANNTLSEGKSDVEACFIELNHWLISRLSLRSQRVCKQPSRFVVRVVWYFVSKLIAAPVSQVQLRPDTAVTNITNVTAPSVANTAGTAGTAQMNDAAGVVVTSTNSKVHVLAVLFRADYSQFVRFVLTLLETQLFVEYLAATFSDDVNN